MTYQKGNILIGVCLVIAAIVALAWKPMTIAMASSSLDEHGKSTAEYSARLYKAEEASDISMPEGYWKLKRADKDVEINQAMSIAKDGRFNWNVIIFKNGIELINKSLSGEFRVKGRSLNASKLTGALGFIAESKSIVIDEYSNNQLVFIDYNNEKISFQKSEI